MLHHSYSPDSFCLSTMIPIPEGSYKIYLCLKITGVLQCVSVLSDYYLHHGNDVNMCSIDVSKAFDRINILLLFRKLLSRNFCPLFLRYLINSYCNQMMVVRWNRRHTGKEIQTEI